MGGTLESRVKLDKEDSQDCQECLELPDLSDPKEAGVTLVILVSQVLEAWDPLGIVNSVTVLLPRQINKRIKKALKLITIPGQALIGPARTAQLPMLQGRLPRILPRAWQPNWCQGHAQYHDYNQYYLFCAQYYNHVNPFIIDLNIHAYYNYYTLMMKSLKYNPIFLDLQ